MSSSSFSKNLVWPPFRISCFCSIKLSRVSKRCCNGASCCGDKLASPTLALNSWYRNGSRLFCCSIRISRKILITVWTYNGTAPSSCLTAMRSSIRLVFRSHSRIRSGFTVTSNAEYVRFHLAKMTIGQTQLTLIVFTLVGEHKTVTETRGLDDKYAASHGEPPSFEMKVS